jgi:hypothetical protein
MQAKSAQEPDTIKLNHILYCTLKRQWGFTYTLMKGKEHVLSEVNLMMMVYNLKRLMSILGVNDLKTRLKQLVRLLMANFKLHRVDLRLFVFSISHRSPKYLLILEALKQTSGALHEYYL